MRKSWHLGYRGNLLWRQTLATLIASGTLGTLSLNAHAASEETVPAAPAKQNASTRPTAEPAAPAGNEHEDKTNDPATGAAELAPVTVEGDWQPTAVDPIEGYVADRSASATKTDTPLRKIPQDITSITTDQMRDRDASDMKTALQYIGGAVPTMRGDYGNIRLRGFEPEQYQDGLRMGTYGYTSPKLDPYLLERIDVVKGPASVLYGQTPPGGVLNYVSKRPSKNAQNEFFLQGGNDAQFRGGFDVSGALDEDDDVRYRVVATGQRRDDVHDHVDSSGFSIAPSLKFDIDEDTDLTLLGQYQYSPSEPYFGALPYYGTVKRLPDGNRFRRSFYDGDKGFQRNEATDYHLGYEFAHRFNDHIKFRQNLRYAHNDADYKSAYGWTKGGAGHVYPDSNGNLVLPRALADASDKRNTFTVDNNLIFDFDTGTISHKVLAGVDYMKIKGRGDRNGFATLDADYDLDIYHPDYHMDPPAPDLTHENFSQYQLGYYLQDQISIGNLILIGGGRYDHVSTDFTQNHDHSTKQSRSDHAATFRAGALYAFDFGLSPYFSYSESFQPPITDGAGGVDANVLKPTRGNQFEVGLKYQPDSRLMMTASAFRMRQKNVPSTDPNNPNRTIQTGKVVVQGVELNATASLLEGLDLIANGTWLHPKIREGEEGQKGNVLSATPKYTASLWMNYTQPSGPLKGLGGGGGVRYVSPQQVDNDNTAKLPAYTTLDGVVHYELGGLSSRMEGWRVALNMKNMTNTKYVASCSNMNGCFYGKGRETTATISYRWD